MNTERIRPAHTRFLNEFAPPMPSGRVPGVRNCLQALGRDDGEVRVVARRSPALTSAILCMDASPVVGHLL